MNNNNNEESFIRGRLQHPHLKRRHNTTYNNNNEENLFGNVNEKSSALVEHRKKVKKMRSKSNNKTPKKDENKLNDITQSKDFSQVELLNFKKLSVGCILLGAISEISELDVTVNLPNGLRGFVSLREVSDVLASLVDAYLENDDDDDDDDDENNNGGLPKLHNIFKLGQIVRCVIIKLEKQHSNSRIELSMRPSLVNSNLKYKDITAGFNVWGSVKSIEDKGYMIDFGFKDQTNTTVFLSKENAWKNIIVGQPHEFAVISHSGRAIKVTSEDLKVNNALVRSSKSKLSFDQLKPGQLVKCKIKRCVSNGLHVTFLKVFDHPILQRII